jgi:signal transduction histidine kinase
MPERDPNPESGEPNLSSLFAGGGEMGELMRRHDWTAISLGPPSAWPHSLRTVVKILLTSRYAMWMGWGPDLSFFYNDAYGAMTLGAKHPWALGRPSREVWAEIWAQIGPRIDKVLTKGEATWDERLMLFLERSGYPEETYHTFSYSPLPDDDGQVRGLFCVVTEETERVIDERRLAILNELGTHLASSKNEEEVFRASERALATDTRDLPFTAVYLFEPENSARLVSVTGANKRDVAALTTLAGLAASWALAADYNWDTPQVVQSPAFVNWPAGPWDKSSTRIFVVPIRQQGQPRAAGVLIGGANPYRRIDDKYRSFVNLYVGQVTAGLANARAYEEERKRAEALAEIDRAKTAFFSNVSHEFRTPLTLILGPTEDALRGTDGALRGEDLRTVYRNEVRLLRLVNALLDFSRIEAGRMQAFFEPVDLSELTGDLAGVFRSTIERGGLRLVVDCPPLAAPVFVDRQMWEKIVLNLLSNAFKFTFEGEIRVRLAPEGDRVMLQVSDTGVGIPVDQQSRIFERFHRIPGVRARTHEGSGIGLALVNDLVRLHGGAIAVASEPGGGTTFSVVLQNGDSHLPADRVGVARSVVATATDALAYAAEADRWLPSPKRTQTVPSERQAETGREQPHAADIRILVVDDNADMREYLTRLLNERWTVETADHGMAALEVIRAHRPTLVLTDVMMPVLDGFGLLREIRRDPSTRSIPVIMLSARAGEESRIEGFEAGADDYLVKPFSARELMARVATRLDLHRLGQRLDRERAALADLFRQTPLPVAVLRGTSLVFEIANDAYLEMIGHRDILGRPLIEAIPEFEGQGFDEMLMRVMRSGVASTGREALLKIVRQGRLEETYWTFIYAPLVGDDGTCDSVVAICSDVTDQVHARHKLEALAAAAESANRAKDEFLAMLGHELRNPLAPIMTAVQLIHLKGAPEIEKERTIIERQTKYLVRLVDDLLDVSRIARGKIELKKERLDAASVVGSSPRRSNRRARCSRNADSVSTWTSPRLNWRSTPTRGGWRRPSRIC